MNDDVIIAWLAKLLAKFLSAQVGKYHKKEKMKRKFTLFENMEILSNTGVGIDFFDQCWSINSNGVIWRYRSAFINTSCSAIDSAPNPSILNCFPLFVLLRLLVFYSLSIHLSHPSSASTSSFLILLFSTSLRFSFQLLCLWSLFPVGSVSLGGPYLQWL